MTPWPNLPPWWLIDAPRLGDILNRPVSDLHRWARQGTGPRPAPFFIHGRKRPWWYWHDVQSWAAGQIGQSFPFDSQVEHFLGTACPILAGGTGDACDAFDKLFEEAAKGGQLLGISGEVVRELDGLWTAQPVRYDSRLFREKLAG